MTHEKIFNRENGSKVKISVWLYIRDETANWGYLLLLQEPDSDHWIDPFNDRAYLAKIFENEPNRGRLHFEDYISYPEVNEAKIELWEKIKPT